MPMKIARTPEARFANLPGFPFEPHYLTVTDDGGTDIQVHYLDEGPNDGDVILLMHGNPTWSYLYRKMIPGLVAAGKRAIAVDLVGCGRSDKPAKRSYYTQARHVDWMLKWFDGMGLQDVTLFCQDWGGTIGLHLVARRPEAFARVIVSNSGLPMGKGGTRVIKLWQTMMKFAWAFPLRKAMSRALMVELSEEEWRAYKAPFGSMKLESAIMSFPGLLGLTSDNPSVDGNREAMAKLRQFEKPFLTIFGAKDPMSRGSNGLRKAIPGAAGQDHQVYPGAGHFIQEDAPEALVRDILAFMAAPAN